MRIFGGGSIKQDKQKVFMLVTVVYVGNSCVNFSYRRVNLGYIGYQGFRFFFPFCDVIKELNNAINIKILNFVSLS